MESTIVTGSSSLRQYDIPTPKVKPRDRVGVHGWVYYYAAFSASFVASTIKALDLHSDSVLLDPFIGSGTTSVVAKQMGVPSVGIELNPAAYFISRGKVAWDFERNELEEELRVLETVSNFEVEPSLQYAEWYAPDDPAVEKTLALGHYILENVGGEMQDFLITALLLSLRSVARVRRGSNPVWTRVNTQIKTANRDVFPVFASKARAMFSDLEKIKTYHKCRSEILFGDTRKLVLPEDIKNVDAIITSPPYLNRLDYIVNFRLENEFLANLKVPVDWSVKRMRKEIIGSIRVVDKSPPEEKWGQTCLAILNRIRNHPSKASATYYYPTIMKYFKDMYQCIDRFHDVLKPDGPCIIVVQTSYYKDIEIPVSQIFMDMAKNIGFKECSIVRRENVRVHMGLVDPEQRTYAPKKILHEDVLLLK